MWSVEFVFLARRVSLPAVIQAEGEGGRIFRRQKPRPQVLLLKITKQPLQDFLKKSCCYVMYRWF